MSCLCLNSVSFLLKSKIEVEQSLQAARKKQLKPTLTD